MSSKLDLLAATLDSYIEAAPELVAHDGHPAIGSITEKKGDIATTVTAALGKLGISIVVIVSDSSFGSAGDAKGLHEARLIVEIAEIYTTNKTGRRCLEVAEAVARAGLGKPNGLGPILGRPRTFQLEPGPNLRLVPHPTQVIRHVAFVTEYML
jgi:hypothetical protein